jgi:hypothetical protein
MNLATSGALDANFDIVKYWQSLRGSNRLSKLAAVAPSVFMIPVTSVDERSFSKTGQILSHSVCILMVTLKAHGCSAIKLDLSEDCTTTDSVTSCNHQIHFLHLLMLH